MSQTAIFIIGVIVFAITVYGTVMSAGLALTRAEISQDPALKEAVDDSELGKTFPDVQY
ncbi:MAG: hypothetical protein ACI88C_000909 [Acidimicrobiales bacterium]|mgnify:FL=1